MHSTPFMLIKEALNTLKSNKFGPSSQNFILHNDLTGQSKITLIFQNVRRSFLKCLICDRLRKLLCQFLLVLF